MSISTGTEKLEIIAIGQTLSVKVGTNWTIPGIVTIGERIGETLIAQIRFIATLNTVVLIGFVFSNTNFRIARAWGQTLRNTVSI